MCYVAVDRLGKQSRVFNVIGYHTRDALILRLPRFYVMHMLSVDIWLPSSGTELNMCFHNNEYEQNFGISSALAMVKSQFCTKSLISNINHFKIVLWSQNVYVILLSWLIVGPPNIYYDYKETASSLLLCYSCSLVNWFASSLFNNWSFFYINQ